MARFEPKTFSYFFQRLAYRIVARTSLSDLEVGGVIHTCLMGIAALLDDLSYQMVNLQKLWDIDTATGSGLDERAKDVNPDEIERLGGAKATTTVIFARSGTSGVVTVPVGHRVFVLDGGPEYVTSALATIPDLATAAAPVAAEAVADGEDGNVVVGAITGMDPVAGVETVTNDAVATGGRDEELDTEFRERIKAYLRSLSRGTPDALKYAALGVTVSGYGRVITVEVYELPSTSLGQTYVYIDDGNGTVEHIADNTGSPETVVAVASGGELRAWLDHNAVVSGLTVTIEWWDGLAWNTLVEGTDYWLNYPRGRVHLIPGGPAAIPVTGLAAGDGLRAQYSWYEGLIPEVQLEIDGDPTNRAEYPGYRAAGTQVWVLAPQVYYQVVEAEIVLEDGYDAATVLSAVTSAISRYINGLGINGDVIYTELVHVVQAVPGVYDVVFATPTANVTIGSGELARISSTNIDLAVA